MLFLSPLGTICGGLQSLTPRAEEEEAAAKDRRTQQRIAERDGSEVRWLPIILYPISSISPLKAAVLT